MPIDTARAIASVGFRKWYERQLIESHAWLVTCLLCGIAMAASIEMLNLHDVGGTIVTVAFVFTAGLIVMFAFRRYRLLMEQAEHLARHSTCTGCQAYARFRPIDQNPRMKVECRKCGHQWTLG